MKTIKKFFECTVPISNCNLKCSYCYVIQENRRDIKTTPFKLTPEDIGQAFSQKRIGGVAMFNLCGFGETLIPEQMPDVIYNLLKQGHFVNVTNNGTMTQRINKIIEFPPEYLSRLSFAFSFHYDELIKKNLLQTFIDNVKKVKAAGCSIVIQLNMADEYMDNIEEIKEVSKREFGVLPQVALTRRESKAGYSIMTEKGDDEYIKCARTFDSPLFEFTLKNFKQKRKEFCYAGAWSYKVNLATGECRACNSAKVQQNLYKDFEEPIKECAVGNCCRSPYCVNSSHYLSLGDIPELDTPSYVDLRNRKEKEWYSKEMNEFLSHKLYENNSQYGKIKKIKSNVYQKVWYLKNDIRKVIKKFLKR